MQYSVINYSHHAKLYIPITYLFSNWKFESFDPTYISGNHQSVLCIYEFAF